MGLGTDQGIFIWAFAWWPHALVHGLNPFDSHIIYAPQGFNIALGALIPAAAILLWPVTAIWGPLTTYNVAMLLSPVLAAFFVFLLCRRVTGRFWPSLFGGWVFGFSTYMLGELAGHVHLTLVFLIPAMVHLVLRRLDGDITPWKFYVAMVVALVLQVLISGEVFVSFTLFGLAALIIAYLLGDAALRLRLRGTVRPIVICYLITAVIVSPYLVYAFKPGGLPVLPSRTDQFSTDLLSFLIPSADTQLGGHHFLATTHTFVAGWIEGGAYLGVPLIVILWLAIRRGWAQRWVRIAVVTLAFVVLCALGGHLNIEGSSGIPLPWLLAEHLPIVGLILPSRFVAYVFLIGGILAAAWLAAMGTRIIPWALAVLSVVFLWPALGTGFWNGTPNLPAFFTSAAYRHVIGPRDTALVLPVGEYGNSMLWQAEASLRFTMASGYVVPPEAPDPYKKDPLYPTLMSGARVPDEEGAAASFLYSHHITVAVFEPGTPYTTVWPGILSRLGWTGVTEGGVEVMRPGPHAAVG